MGHQNDPNKNRNDKPQGISKRSRQSRAASSRGARGAGRGRGSRRGSTTTSAAQRAFEGFTAALSAPPSLREAHNRQTTKPKPKPQHPEHWKEYETRLRESVKRFIAENRLPGRPVKQPDGASQGPQAPESDDARDLHRGDDDSGSDIGEKSLPLEPTSPKDVDPRGDPLTTVENAGVATTSSTSGIDFDSHEEAELARRLERPDLLLDDSASDEDAGNHSCDDGSFSSNEGGVESAGDEMDLDD